MRIILKAGQAQIDYVVNPGMISEYYLYICRLFKQVLTQTGLRHNYIIADHISSTPCIWTGGESPNPIYTVAIQLEHTLVRKGGRSAHGALPGKIPDGEGDFYLVRLAGMDQLMLYDFIIEYSYANIANLAASGRFKEYLDKTLHIAPIIYDHKILHGITTDCSDRSTDVLTTFINPGEPRRARVITQLSLNNINHNNVSNCFEHSGIRLEDTCLNQDDRNIIKLYSSAKVLLNIHQTDHHHTLEELRVLPALTAGIIVISEDVPLKESIPYSSYIIWVGRDDNLIEIIQNVLLDYSKYYQEFTIANPNLQSLLEEIHLQNIRNVENKLLSLTGRQTASLSSLPFAQPMDGIVN